MCLQSVKVHLVLFRGDRLVVHSVHGYSMYALCMSCLKWLLGHVFYVTKTTVWHKELFFSFCVDRDMKRNIVSCYCASLWSAIILQSETFDFYMKADSKTPRIVSEKAHNALHCIVLHMSDEIYSFWDIKWIITIDICQRWKHLQRMIGTVRILDPSQGTFGYQCLHQGPLSYLAAGATALLTGSSHIRWAGQKAGGWAQSQCYPEPEMESGIEPKITRKTNSKKIIP